MAPPPTRPPEPRPPSRAEPPDLEPGPVAESPLARAVITEPARTKAAPEPVRAPTTAARQEPPPPAAGPEQGTALAEEAAPSQALPPQSIPAEEIAADACILLIHVDVADLLGASDQVRLQTLLRDVSGWRVGTAATYGGGSAMANQALGLVERAQWAAPPPRLALVQDGSQPPITELLRFLRALRAAVGDHAQVLITLVGDPEGDDPLSPLPEFERSDWQSKIDQLGDPYLRLETLLPPERGVT